MQEHGVNICPASGEAFVLYLNLVGGTTWLNRAVLLAPSYKATKAFLQTMLTTSRDPRHLPSVPPGIILIRIWE